MTEIDVTLTDYILCIESLIFFFLIQKTPIKEELKTSYLILFLSFALSSFLGGTYHGFIKSPFLWQATIISIGMTAYGFALSGIVLLCENSSIKSYKILLSTILLIYILSTFITQTFLSALLIYLPATILTLIGFTKSYNKNPDKNLKFGIIGLYISLFAPIIQQFKITIHPTYLSHNAIYHIVIMLSLFFSIKG
jgi:cell division protein FtsX